MLLPRRRYPLVERRDSLDRETVTRDYLCKNRPVVVGAADAAKQTPWGLDALRSAYGEHTIVGEETAEVYVGRRARRRLTLSEMIDSVVAGDGSLRWKGLDLCSEIEPLARQLEASPPPSDALLPSATASTRRAMWLAPKGTMSSFHHDGNSDNFNWQVQGKKLFLLLPPSQLDRLHAHGSAESPINPFHPDLTRFPRFAGAAALEATLAPGDVLLIPKYWWHCVYTVEPSVNLNTWLSFGGEISAWRALAGVPLFHRTCASLAAEMKRRRLMRLASVTRRVWSAVYDRLTESPPPQPRGELLDP